MNWRYSKKPVSRITAITEKEGTSIEEVLRRVAQTKEPIDALAPLRYTERAAGVLPQFDMRADPMELAQDAKHKWFDHRQQVINDADAAKAKAKADALAAAAAAAKAAGSATIGDA